MKRLLVATVVALALPLLAACSGGGDTPGTATSGAPTQEGPGETDTPAIAGGDDEFCELAAGAVPLAMEIDQLTAGMSTTVVEAIGSGDIAAINAWGAELAELDEQMLQFYADGRPFIEEDSIVGAWDLMEQFVREYSLAVAQEAATTTDTDDFTARLGEIVQEPSIQAAVNFSPAASAQINQYIVTRCGAIDAA